MSVSRISLKNSRGLILMSHPILGSFIAVAALLLLGSAYLMADDSTAGASLLAVVGVGILLSGVRVIRRRRLG
jgi:membrane-bound ClpP family serine protease